MDLIASIKQISENAKKHVHVMETEEATKNALIMPFIQALGYAVFNPLEVVPEFVSDVGKKRGEKVDYAIMHESKVAMLIECKSAGANLKLEHAAQLYRYFTSTAAKFAILTNGTLYKFYTDIDKVNVMDERPFFEFDILDYDDKDIGQLKKFSKEQFDIENIVSTASDLKYSHSIQQILEGEISDPSEEFVKYFASKVYFGRMTQSVKDQFSKIVKDALNHFIKDKVAERLNKALHSEEAIESVEIEEPKSNIETTQEEIDAYNIVKAILHEVVDMNRVVMRDTQSYCGILLDDNNRKPLCRLHFNGGKKYLGLFSQKNETRKQLSSLNEIFTYSKELKETAQEYDN